MRSWLHAAILAAVAAGVLYARPAMAAGGRISVMVGDVGSRSGESAELATGVAAGLRQWLRNQGVFYASSPEQLGVESGACLRTARCLREAMCRLELDALVTVEARSVLDAEGGRFIEVLADVQRCPGKALPTDRPVRVRVRPPGDALDVLGSAGPLVRDVLQGREIDAPQAKAGEHGGAVVPERRPRRTYRSRYLEPEPVDVTPWSIGLGAASAVALAAGVGLSIKSAATAEDVRSDVRDSAAVQALINRGEREVLWSRIFFVSSAAFLGAAIALPFVAEHFPRWTRDDEEVEPDPWSLRPAVDRDALGLVFEVRR